MKAIAEYFRDLAADDRYFGAEPPTPDAEMLARIAEREIARRVEAHEEQGKIVLRAEAGTALGQAVALANAPEAQAPAPEQAPEPAPEPVQDVAPSPEPTPEPEVEQSAPEQEVAAPEVVEKEISEDIQTEVAEAAPVEMPEGLEEEAVAEPEAVEDEQATAEPEPVEEEQAVAEPEPVAQDDVQPEVEAEDVAQDLEQVQEPAAPGDSESIAAKLSRIRSVVSGAEQSFGADEYNEDEHAQGFIDTTTADLNAALAEDDAAQSTDASYSMVEIDDDELAAIMARANAMEAPEDEDALQEVEAEDQAQETAQDDVATDERNEFEDTLASLLADAMPVETARVEIEEITEIESVTEIEETVAPEAELSVAAAAEDEPALTNARVIKIKRAEFEAAVASGLFQEDDDTSEESDSNLFEEGDSFLSPEEEAELQRELAEVEAEFENDLAEDFAEIEDEIEDAAEDAGDDLEDAAEDDAAEAEDEDDAEIEEETAADFESEEEQDEEPQQGRRKLETAETPSDLTRIFDETDNQLDAPASSQRRNAIQHLRAAVAATRAETEAGAKPSRGVDDTAYRDDLANVVRPRRPQVVSDAGRSARPEEVRPAPLKLVAEQRIDTPREPIRPRRVSTSDIAPEMEQTGGDSGFSAFAEEMGANQLPELLEAAAAYLADVEGRPQFSRPMLMGKLKEVEQESFSREDGLRSFGQLLRQGKLQKLAGGRFSVTNATDYRDPGARNVG
ncbi:hypothetical protein [Roseovarius gaetbuli]|nr:hypothetical protein [Roseovarius gaetbuli]